MRVLLVVDVGLQVAVVCMHKSGVRGAGWLATMGRAMEQVAAGGGSVLDT